MDIVSYNCCNFKANNLMIDYLINNNDICFFIEHWLGADDAHYFNEICTNHSIIFKSDYENTFTRRGRPFGGTCWTIHNKIKIIESNELSASISKVVIEEPSLGKLVLFGIWQPFDDGSYDKLALLYSTLSILEHEIEDLGDDNYLILGDFNADFFNRSKRFDKLFLSLLERKNITDAASLFNCTDINTYSKGSYGAVFDHILVSPSLIERISNSE